MKMDQSVENEFRLAYAWLDKVLQVQTKLSDGERTLHVYSLDLKLAHFIVKVDFAGNARLYAAIAKI